MRKLQKSLWYWIAGVFFLALMIVLIGIMSNKIVTILFGTFLFSVIASSFLTSYVKSDHIVKRTLEVILLFMAFGVVIYGYVITRSLILEAVLLFALALFAVALCYHISCPKLLVNSEVIANKENAARNLGRLLCTKGGLSLLVPEHL